MNLGSTIIGIICITLCALPFILTSANRKKKEKQLLNALKEIAQEHQSGITQHDIFGYCAIGLDELKKSVSFILRTDDAIKPQFVNLSTISSCEIANITKSKHLDRLYLKLKPIDKNQPEMAFEFFNADVNYQLNDELQSIGKWNTLINNLLKSENTSAN